ncbi:hypothetical protein ALP65_04670 [Pseudomonas aeruginosa]|uniref:Uncharacterized protein n=1 Tax=Pseudomonas aeruginosa TaxID=287 RepID=A0A3M5DZ36_PSEAI|nr:hypothetical protein ALP65_04670 [Pseudomonas aeruginosa]
MDGRGHLARRPGHAPVGDQRHLEATILQDPEERRELVQLRHAVRPRALETHHGDQVALQLAGLEGRGQAGLVVEDPYRRLDHLVFRRHRRDLHHAATEVALHQAQAAFGGERLVQRTQDGFVETPFRPFAPDQPAILEERLAGVAAQAGAGDGLYVLVKQPAVEQLADQEGHAAGRLEVVDVGLAVRIDARQGRHHMGQLGHVLPGQLDARRLGDRQQVQGVVGRAAGGEQRHHRVDDGLLVDDLRHRHVVAVLGGQPAGLACRFAGEFVAQGGVRVDEGGTGQVQAHHLHQQLVGIGGAIEGAGAGCMVGGHFRGQQLFASGLALGEQLAHRGLFLVGDAGRHRPGRDEHGGQVAEAQRADQQARHDLVANTQAQRCIEHVVRQRDGGGHGDHVAAGQRQFHARLALGHPVAHGRHAAGELADRTDLVQRLLDQPRKALERLVRREHVVVGGNDGHVGLVHQPQGLLVAFATGRDPVGEVAARQGAAVRPLAGRSPDHLEVALASGRATGLDAAGDFEHTRVHGRFSYRLSIVVFTT